MLGAVRSDRTQLYVHRVADVDQVEEARHQRIQIVGVDEVESRSTNQLLRTDTEQPRAVRTHPADQVGAVDGHGDLGTVLGEQCEQDVVARDGSGELPVCVPASVCGRSAQGRFQSQRPQCGRGQDFVGACGAELELMRLVLRHRDDGCGRGETSKADQQVGRTPDDHDRLGCPSHERGRFARVLDGPVAAIEPVERPDHEEVVGAVGREDHDVEPGRGARRNSERACCQPPVGHPTSFPCDRYISSCDSDIGIGMIRNQPENPLRMVVVDRSAGPAGAGR